MKTDINQSEPALMLAIARLATVLLYLFIAFTSTARAADQAGEVILIKGVVTAQAPGSAARTVDKGSAVFEKEHITTAADSYVVIRMADGGKLTLRPNTELVVEAFSQKPDQETEKLRLLKGGLRAVTGAIGKLKPASVQLMTPSASIGIRGTNYIARQCESDCGEEEEELAGEPRRQPGNPDGDDQGLPELTIVCNGEPEAVDREPVGEIKHALYFAVFEGGIHGQVNFGCEQIDLDAVDACYATQNEIHCLTEVPRFILYDRYLDEDTADGQIVLFNLFRDLEDENSRCELPSN